jgi:hypothetical protein
MGFGDPDWRISFDNSATVRDRYATFPRGAEGHSGKYDER